MTATTDQVVADALAEHQTEQLWKPGGWAGDTACSCGWRMGMWSRKDFPEVHRAHQAEAIAAALASTPAPDGAAALTEDERAALGEWNPHWNYHLGGEPRSVCACPDGMYEGARPATWPRYCERCGGLMPTRASGAEETAAVERVRALADEWERFTGRARPAFLVAADELRAALTPTDEQPDAGPAGGDS